MQLDERILTTHCGSLPRPPALSELLLQQEAGEPIDPGALAS
jgi:5-methyltetrahydropteroyltriglutamate--homocysteine methyltransferase